MEENYFSIIENIYLWYHKLKAFNNVFLWLKKAGTLVIQEQYMHKIIIKGMHKIIIKTTAIHDMSIKVSVVGKKN